MVRSKQFLEYKYLLNKIQAMISLSKYIHKNINESVNEGVKT